ncbi:MAG TPA: rhodanese-like domain-containing protein [Vicinamibacterales bacterium]|jgi:adenylyltransferase/sulfurtransferase|nr:rhodanese-like domain-containing protein [Vicinamibacterales bacterium]
MAVTVEELKAKIERGEAPAIVDVREPREWDICRIEGATLIPLGELPQRMEELDRRREMVVLCKVGGRSARAVAFLRQQGFENVHNLDGGIVAWIDRVDPTQRRY